jgi:UDP-N-acetylglucosamine 4,6-dehydratase
LVTDKTMTRYFITLPEAISLLLTASKSEYGNLFVTKMPSCTIGDLAEVVKTKYGNMNTIIKEIGNRGSEKIHEKLINSTESIHTYIYSPEYYVVSDVKLNLPKVNFKEYGSNTQPLMNHQEILTMLGKGGF